MNNARQKVQKMKQQKLSFQNSFGQKIVGILYSPEIAGKICVIFCHGYRSTKGSGRVEPLAERLAKENVSLFAFDFSGRGESQGRFEFSTITKYVDDLSNAIKFISKKYTDICVVGSSLGGYVALNSAIKEKDIKLLVLLSPVSQFPWRDIKEFSPENLKKWKEDGFTYTHSERYGDMKINYTFYEDGIKCAKYKDYGKIKVPVLIVHGTADASVPIDHSRELIKHLKKSRLEELKGADHTYTKSTDAKQADELTANFVTRMLK